MKELVAYVDESVLVLLFDSAPTHLKHVPLVVHDVVAVKPSKYEYWARILHAVSVCLSLAYLCVVCVFTTSKA